VNAQNAANAQSAAAVGANGVGTAALQDGSVTGPKLGAIVARAETVTVPSLDTAGLELGCQPGERLLSGGARWSGIIDATVAADLHVMHSYPVHSTWFARVYNGTGAARDMTVRVHCLDD
jgi:hypothetical protein